VRRSVAPERCEHKTGSAGLPSTVLTFCADPIIAPASVAGPMFRPLYFVVPASRDRR